MKIGIKRFVVIGCVFVFVGIILMGGSYFAGAKTNIYMSKEGLKIQGNYEKNVLSYQKLDPKYQEIEVDLSDIDLEIIPSQEYGIEAVYSVENQKPKIKSMGGKLSITNTEIEEISINIGFNFQIEKESRPVVKLYVPKDSETNIKIMSTNGNIKMDKNSQLKVLDLVINGAYGNAEISGIDAKSMTIERSNSNIKLSDINTGKLEISNEYGDITTKKIKSENSRIIAHSGDVQLNEMTSNKMQIEKSYGNISGEGLKLNGLDLKTNNGDTKLMGDIKGEMIIGTKYGNLTLKTSVQKKDFAYRIHVKYGEVRLDGENFEDADVEQKNTTANSISINSNNGDVKVDFGQ